MTPATADNYKASKAERISSEAQGVINNGDATAEEIRVEESINSIKSSER